MQKVSIMPQHEWKLFDAPRNKLLIESFDVTCQGLTPLLLVSPRRKNSLKSKIYVNSGRNKSERYLSISKTTSLQIA
jgi:hypothetical protein